VKVSSVVKFRLQTIDALKLHYMPYTRSINQSMHFLNDAMSHSRKEWQVNTNTATRLTEKAADLYGTVCGLARVVSALLGSRVNDRRLFSWNDVFTKLWRAIFHQLTCLFSTLHETPRQPLCRCSSNTSQQLRDTTNFSGISVLHHIQKNCTAHGVIGTGISQVKYQ